MERNANRCRIVVLFIIIGALNYSGWAQENAGNNQPLGYSQTNIEVSAHENQFLTDTARFNYDLGFGLALEKEVYRNQKFAVLYNGGLNLYHSRLESENFSARIFAIQAKFGGKYYFTDKTAFYGGVLAYYGFMVQKRDGSRGSWGTLKDHEHFNGGPFIGLDFTMKSWSSFRFWYSLTPRMSTFQLSFAINTAMLFQ